MPDWLENVARQRGQLQRKGKLTFDFSVIAASVLVFFIPLQALHAPILAMITGLAGLLLLAVAALTLRWGGGRGVANLLMAVVAGAPLIIVVGSGGHASGAIMVVPVLIILATLLLDRPVFQFWVVLLLLVAPVAWFLRSTDIAFPLTVSPALNDSAVFRLPIFLSLLSVLLGIAYQRAMDHNLEKARLAEAGWRKESEQTTLEHDRLRHFADLAADVLWETDENYRLVSVSRGFDRLFGIPGSQCLGLTPVEVYQRYSDFEGGFERYFDPLEQRQRFSGQVLQWTVDRNRKTMINSGKPVFSDSGLFCGYRGILRDITELTRLRTDLERKASLDALTGLLNRRGFCQRLEAALANSEADDKPLALIYLDLDGFKSVNDAAGHQAGDDLLVLIADGLVETSRDAVFGRIGGDEFVCFLERTDAPTAEDWALSIVECVRSVSMLREGTVLRVSASAGLKVGIGASSDNAEDWLAAADKAAYRAKSEGNGRVYRTPHNA